MRVIISGGGTGGHIYPAIAIAKELLNRVPSCEILFVGTEKGMESKIVPQAGFSFQTINISGIDRSSLMKAGKSLLKVPISFWQAKRIINDFKPDVVVGTGGYVSYPVVLAGTFFANKTIIHEQNAMPGLANRNLAQRVNYTLLTFEEAANYLNAKKIIVTGMPIRKEILEVDKIKAQQALGDDDNRFTLLAFGGSRGAMNINRAMLHVVEKYKNNKIHIIWITGEEHFTVINNKLTNIKNDNMSLKLTILPYMHNIEDAFAVSDLAICRAGASTISELAAIGLPAILVPYPYAAENHQEKNAKALVQKNGAEMVIDEYLDGYTLINKIEELRNNKEKMALMRKNLLKEAKLDALNRIVNIIIEN